MTIGVIATSRRVDDLVRWDNRGLLQRGRPGDESNHRRLRHRTAVAGPGLTAIDGQPL